MFHDLAEFRRHILVLTVGRRRSLGQLGHRRLQPLLQVCGLDAGEGRYAGEHAALVSGEGR